jgi:hypothetical protein
LKIQTNSSDSISPKKASCKKDCEYTEENQSLRHPKQSYPKE